MEHKPYQLAAAIILSCGLIISGYFISKTVQKAGQNNRYVIVKGLAEREVEADLAIWPITIKIAGDDLTILNNKTTENIEIVKQFLIGQGFKPDEFILDDYNINDLLTNAYRNNSTENARYIIQATILLKTKNVEQVKKASYMQYLLAQKGVILGAKNDYEATGPIYILSRFNELKSEMLSEAIKNARNAAQQFAIDSGSRVGKIKTANQGSFIISQAEGADFESGANQEKRSIRKKIRVVTTLEYFLK